VREICRRRFVDWHPPSWHFRKCGRTGAETAAILSFLRDHRARLYVLPPIRGVAKDGPGTRQGKLQPLHRGPKKARFLDWNAPAAPEKTFFYFFDSLAKVCYFSIWGVSPREFGKRRLGKTASIAGKRYRRRKKSLAFDPVDRVGSFDPAGKGDFSHGQPTGSKLIWEILVGAIQCTSFQSNPFQRFSDGHLSS